MLAKKKYRSHSAIHKIAVSQNGEALHFIPYNMRTQELCEIAVNHGHDGLIFVPDHLRTSELNDSQICNDLIFLDQANKNFFLPGIGKKIKKWFGGNFF